MIAGRLEERGAARRMIEVVDSGDVKRRRKY
jgi:hypothetical protein